MRFFAWFRRSRRARDRDRVALRDGETSADMIELPEVGASLTQYTTSSGDPTYEIGPPDDLLTYDTSVDPSRCLSMSMRPRMTEMTGMTGMQFTPVVVQFVDYEESQPSDALESSGNVMSPHTLGSKYIPTCFDDSRDYEGLSLMGKRERNAVSNDTLDDIDMRANGCRHALSNSDENVIADSKVSTRQTKPQKVPGLYNNPMSRAFPSTKLASSLRRVRNFHTPGRQWMSGVSFRNLFQFHEALSLRCWVLFPLIVIMVSVCIVVVPLTFVSTNQASRETLESLHDVIKVNYASSVGHTVFGKMSRLAKATVSMHLPNNMLPGSSGGGLMGTGEDILSRLCVALRDMDKSRVIFSLGVISLGRELASICVAPHERPSEFYGVSSNNGLIDGYYHMDNATMEYRQPLTSYYTYTRPMSVHDYAAKHGFDTVVDEWVSKLGADVPFNASGYWPTPRPLPTYVSFVYPFLEAKAGAKSSVGFMFVTVHTESIAETWHNANESGVRVMYVDPYMTSNKILVFANNWGQRLSNATSDWESGAAGSPISYLATDDINDPLMLEALAHVNITKTVVSNENQREHFMYKGFDGMVSVERVTTEDGFSMVVVVATSRGYYLGPTYIHISVSTLIGILSFIFIAAACVYFVEKCLYYPLRRTGSNLKAALTGSPFNPGKHKVIFLHEMRELERVCNTLGKRLYQVRSYVPDRLLGPEDDEIISVGRGVSNPVVLDSAYSQMRHSDGLRSVMCSVAYVFYTPRRVPNPTNEDVEAMMCVVAKAVDKCGGCFEVQRPDYCVVSFGAQMQNRGFAVEAAQAVIFAKMITSSMRLSDAAGTYRVVVESGSFQSGVVSGGDRSRFVLLCRNLHHRVGSFLKLAGVETAVTEETALLVCGRFCLLPFETVCLETRDFSTVKLHEVVDKDAKMADWEEYMRYYTEAYDMMARGDYHSAMWIWDATKSVDATLPDVLVDKLTSHVGRLRAECATRISKNDTAPYMQQCRIEYGVGDEFSTTECSQTSSTTITMSRACDDLLHDVPVQLLNSQSHSFLDETSTEVPRQIIDCYGITWNRSIDPIVTTDTSYDAAYMGISATGTLAVLKLYAFTEAGLQMPHSELNAVLETLLDIGENDSLVQCISYCHVPPFGVILVREYVPGGTLRDLKSRYGRKLPPMAVKRNVTSVLRGLSRLHGRGLVHGRVCSENVVVGVEGHCRLMGMLLGASTLLVQQAQQTISPEEAMGKPQTSASDIYALGLLVLEMLTDTHPWRWSAAATVTRSQQELWSTVNNRELFVKALGEGLLEPAPLPQDADETLCIVLKSCLHRDPSERLPASEILKLIGE